MLDWFRSQETSTRPRRRRHFPVTILVLPYTILQRIMAPEPSGSSEPTRVLWKQPTAAAARELWSAARSRTCGRSKSSTANSTFLLALEAPVVSTRLVLGNRSRLEPLRPQVWWTLPERVPVRISTSLPDWARVPHSMVTTRCTSPIAVERFRNMRIPAVRGV